ncbi:oxidoreductase [Aureococcus anophagefferens]|nr:oxidoreductase [Aureococcus anophagefferens]
MFDADDSGKMGFEELEHVLRDGFPGLHIPADELRDDDVKGLWKALDADRSREVCVQEFMVFMRRHGSAHSMHRLTDYAKAKRGLLEVERRPEPVLLPVERLRAVAQRLHRALGGFLRRQGVKLSIAEMWTKLFELTDADGSGRLRFAELLEAVRKLGLGEQHLAERDVLGLWTHADADASGELSADEFQDAVYRLEVEAWLNLDTVEGEARLRQLVSVLDAAAEKWHRASGNWYKIFRMFDADDSGHMQFEELEHVLRDGYPGLGLGEKQVSTPHLQGMWRSLDADRSGQVSVQEFMVFMRRHGAEHSMHRLTAYSMEKRGLTPQATARPKHVELPVDRLHGVCKLIDKALVADFRRRGVHSSIAGNVKRLFREIDEDGSDRVTLAELEGAVRIRLRLGEGQVTKEDLLGLWTFVDADKSGALTAEEFQLALYHFEVESWPDYLAPELTAELRRILGVMNAAAEKWHQAGGNWFKIFKRLDTSGDGLMGFEEIEHIIRAIFPGLHITKKELSEENLRGLWKALDADRSGAISVQEFMIFMRRHGMHHETIPYIATKQQKDRLASEMSLDRLDIKFGFGKLRVRGQVQGAAEAGPDINEWAARRDESGGDAASESVELVERAKSAAVLGRDLEADAAAALVETATGYIPPWAWRFRRLALEALGATRSTFHQHRLRRWLGAADGRDARAKVFTILYCVYGNAIVVSALQLLRRAAALRELGRADLAADSRYGMFLLLTPYFLVSLALSMVVAKLFAGYGEAVDMIIFAASHLLVSSYEALEDGGAAAAEETRWSRGPARAFRALGLDGAVQRCAADLGLIFLAWVLVGSLFYKYDTPADPWNDGYAVYYSPKPRVNIGLNLGSAPRHPTNAPADGAGKG